MTVTGGSEGEALELLAEWHPDPWSDEAGADVLERAEAYLSGRTDVAEVKRRHGRSVDYLFVRTELWDLNVSVDPTIDRVGLVVYSPCYFRD